MNTIATIFRYEVSDALRSRWLILHFLLYLLLTEGLLLASGWSDKALVSLINVVLLLVPLISLVFGVVHQYNARDFVELLLTQPIRRSRLFAGLALGVMIPLATTFALGVFLPFVWHGGLTATQGVRLLVLIGLGSVLTATGVATALAIATGQSDRVRGIGLALMIWLGYAILYDGAVMLAVTQLDAWPLERAMLVVMLLNPVDLVRLVLLQLFDAAAMMGYTGAVFTRFFGSLSGALVSGAALTFWVAAPVLLARRLFIRKDF